MPDFPSFSPEFEACLGEGAGVYSLVSLWQEGCAAAAGCRVSRSWIYLGQRSLPTSRFSTVVLPVPCWWLFSQPLRAEW